MLSIPIPRASQRSKRIFTPYVKITKPPRVSKPKVAGTDFDLRRGPHGPCMKRRKAIRPDTETLQRLVWEKPLRTLAKGYDVSDTAFKKWCKAANVTIPPQGYWVRRECGYSHEEALVSHKRPIKGKRFITEELARQAYSLIRAGASFRKAAASIGFKHWGLQCALQRYGIMQIGSPPSDRTTTMPS